MPGVKELAGAAPAWGGVGLGSSCCLESDVAGSSVCANGTCTESCGTGACTIAGAGGAAAAGALLAGGAGTASVRAAGATDEAAIAFLPGVSSLNVFVPSKDDADTAGVGRSVASVAALELEAEAPLTTIWIATGDVVSVETKADNGIALSLSTLPA
jgi:hypothetical protein